MPRRAPVKLLDFMVVRHLGFRLALVIALACASASARAEDRRPSVDQKVTRSDNIMGTIVSITIWSGDEREGAAAIGAAFDEFRRIQALMTSWTDDSVVARVTASAGQRKGAAVDDETLAVIQRSLEISRLTDGAFDITVGAFHDLWKFGSNQTGELPTDEQVAEAVRAIGWKRIKVDAKRKTVRLTRKGMAITLGGIAKGYAVDRAVAMLRERGFRNFIVQAGGDLFVAGRKGDRQWVVGIRDPRGSRTTPFAITEIENKTFSTSGDYERAFVKNNVRYHHILDPKTGRPAMKSRSVTVMADDAITADGLSTALFVLGTETGLKLVEKLDGVEAVFVDADNQVHVSSGLKGKPRILSPPTDGV